MLSSSTHSALADQHLDRLAFDWQSRQRAIESHALDFATLDQRDHAMRLHMQALLQLGVASTACMAQRLQDPIGRGELFAMAWTAMASGHEPTQRSCMALAQAMPDLRAPYAAALQWASAQQAWHTLDLWTKADASPQTQAPDSGAQQTPTRFLHDAYLISVAMAHPTIAATLQTSAWWKKLIKTDDHVPLTALLLMECALHLPQHSDLEACALRSMRAASPHLRRLAAEAVLYRPWRNRPDVGADAKTTLLALAIDSKTPSDVSQASEAVLALACWAPKEWPSVLAHLERQDVHRALYLQALGWCGSMAGVPTLIDHLNHPQYARIAAAALSMLTGSSSAHDRWQANTATAVNAAKEVTPGDDIPAAKPYADIPAPDKTAFVRWWLQNAGRFGAQHRWLGGLICTPENLHSVLRFGKQAWRTVAALRLQALCAGPRLDVQAPSYQQLQWLAQQSTHSKEHHP